MKNQKSNQKSKIKNQKYLVCFDLDGTLMDSMSVVNGLFFDMVDNDLGLSTKEYRKNRQLWAVSVHERFDMFFKEQMKKKGVTRKQTDDFLMKFRAEKKKIDFPLVPGAKKAVELVSRYFDNVACVSNNKDTALVDYLEKLGIAKYFKKVIGNTGLKHSKPDPEIYEKAVSAFGLEKENCVTFEDSSVGIQSAKNAGIKAIAIATGVETFEELKKTKADLVLEKFSDLKIEMIFDLFGISANVK
jgi:beta-phosphoglucomutase